MLPFPKNDPYAFLDWMLLRFPEFRDRWGEGARDESLMFHSICSAFSSFYIHDIADYTEARIAEFFRLAEDVIAADPGDRDRFANALCTCFLENISCTWAGQASVPLMGEASYRFFKPWHNDPPYER